jgi:hypothetical protein
MLDNHPDMDAPRNRWMIEHMGVNPITPDNAYSNDLLSVYVDDEY